MSVSVISCVGDTRLGKRLRGRLGRAKAAVRKGLRWARIGSGSDGQGSEPSEGDGGASGGGGRVSKDHLVIHQIHH